LLNSTLHSNSSKSAPVAEPAHDSPFALDRASKITLAVACVIFLLCGLSVLPYPGLQNDEALFAAPLFSPTSNIASISFANHRIPTMQMSYLGCLKAWIFKPIFALWTPSLYSVRIPALLLGVVTICLFWLFVRWTAGDCAAIVATILLASDTSFLLTTCFDWGPVALQHLLTVSGVLALIGFYRLRKELVLGVGFFLFGLALWDKAIFSWSLAGLVIATVLLFPRELRQVVNARRALISLLFFLIGAFPLLWYNLMQGGETFGGNANFSLRDISAKLAALRTTVNGSAFFGYLVADSAGFRSNSTAPTQFQSSVLAIGHAIPIHQNLNEFSFLLALALLPLLLRTPVRKTLLFSLAVSAIVWFQMAITIGAGTGAHHAVLIWPWPMFFMGVAFSEASIKLSRKRAIILVMITGFLVMTNVLLSNEYLTQLIQDGPSSVWTDAVFPLARYLRMQKTGDIYTVDWGTSNSLRLLDRGALRLQEATFILRKEAPDQSDRDFLRYMITRSDDLLVAHTTDFEAFPGINSRLNALAATMGYQRSVLGRIYDLHGRPTFEIVRFTRENIR
jgi:hypothetical protein